MLFDYFPEEGSPVSAEEFLIATVGARDSGGTTLIFPGQTEATTKKYKRLSTYTPTAGARVLVAKVNGSYVILGAVTS